MDACDTHGAGFFFDPNDDGIYIGNKKLKNETVHKKLLTVNKKRQKTHFYWQFPVCFIDSLSFLNLVFDVEDVPSTRMMLGVDSVPGKTCKATEVWIKVVAMRPLAIRYFLDIIVL